MTTKFKTISNKQKNIQGMFLSVISNITKDLKNKDKKDIIKKAMIQKLYNTDYCVMLECCNKRTNTKNWDNINFIIFCKHCMNKTSQPAYYYGLTSDNDNDFVILDKEFRNIEQSKNELYNCCDTICNCGHPICECMCDSEKD